MPPEVRECPSCGGKKGFHVYQCGNERCGAKYCASCDGSGGGRHCPVCKSEKQRTIADIKH